MRTRTILFSLLLALAAGAPMASARPAPQMAMPSYVIPTQGQRQQNLRPLREVVNELRAQYGGQYIAHRVEDGPTPIYVIRWRLPDGQVRDFRVPAAR